jgi:hypothetical protein
VRLELVVIVDRVLRHPTSTFATRDLVAKVDVGGLLKLPSMDHLHNHGSPARLEYRINSTQVNKNSRTEYVSAHSKYFFGVSDIS